MTTIRWIRPVWLSLDQAIAYCSLPPYILRAMLANRLLRRAGTKINRDSIDRLLLQGTLSGQPIFFGTK